MVCYNRDGSVKLMIIPQKEEIICELDKFDNYKIKKEVLSLYEHLLGTKAIGNSKDSVAKVLKEMFKNQYSNEVYIPMNFFINSSIAKVLFNVMYMNDVLYSTSELIDLTKSREKPNGYTRVYICKEVKSGNLKAIKKGRNYIFEENEVKRYLATKGLDFKN